MNNPLVTLLLIATGVLLYTVHNYTKPVDSGIVLCFPSENESIECYDTDQTLFRSIIDHVYSSGKYNIPSLIIYEPGDKDDMI